MNDTQKNRTVRQKGHYKLINGDCLEVMKQIPDKSIDMILCDPPYGTIACKWDNIIPFEFLWKEYPLTERQSFPNYGYWNCYRCDGCIKK